MVEGATAMAGTAPMRFTTMHASLIGASVWIAALAGALVFGVADWRMGFVVGVVAGGIGGAVGLAIIGMTKSSAPSAALLGRVVGFFVRMLLILGGLLVTMRGYHADPVAFVFAFFPLFFVFTGLEHFVSLAANTTQALPGARGGT